MSRSIVRYPKTERSGWGRKEGRPYKRGRIASGGIGENNEETKDTFLSFLSIDGSPKSVPLQQIQFLMKKRVSG